VARLAQRLAAPAAGQEPPPLALVTGVVAEPVTVWPSEARDEVGPAVEEVAAAPATEAVRHTGDLLERLPEAGAVVALAALWSDLGPRPLGAPPYDRRPWLARCGIAAAGGELKPQGAVWSSVARRDVDAGKPAPWPPEDFNVAQWYENLPDASNDLFARFRAEFGVSGE
jgi:hypothetical protein